MLGCHAGMTLDTRRIHFISYGGDTTGASDRKTKKARDFQGFRVGIKKPAEAGFFNVTPITFLVSSS